MRSRSTLGWLMFLALLLAACVPQAAGTAGAGGGPGVCPSTIEIRDFSFRPANCSVAPGTTLTFVNRDEAPHTATTLEEAVAGFDTGTLQRGQSATVTLMEPGDYPYFCEIHPGMRALITVAAPAEDAAGADADTGE